MTYDRRDNRLTRRLRLRRADGTTYLERWGLSHPRIGGILIHRMGAPDPGVDLHDHPWWFVTLPLWGGYTEERALSQEAPALAGIAASRLHADVVHRGYIEERRPLRPRVMRLDECHTVTALRRRTAWSLVICGPRRRSWGFYLPTGWVNYRAYEQTERGKARRLIDDIERP